jgi:UDP-2-acetamido-3-amino-2,3-dideoxy-glucuronate N-acetyltransferase
MAPMSLVTLEWQADALQQVQAALDAWLDHGWAVAVQTAAGREGSAQAADGAVVEPGAVLGAGSRIWRFTHVRAGAAVGRESNVGQGVYVDAGVVIGARCKIQNGANLYRGVVLGDGVFVGPGATFTNDLFPRAEGAWAVTPTLVGSGASIGANATVVCGSHIGPYAMVGAGAVVTRPVPPHALMLGVPARQAGYVCVCGRRAAPDGSGGWRCPACGAAVPGTPP